MVVSSKVEQEQEAADPGWLHDLADHLSKGAVSAFKKLELSIQPVPPEEVVAEPDDEEVRPR